MNKNTLTKDDKPVNKNLGQHTPGPWEVSGSLIVGKGGNAVVARVTSYYEGKPAEDYHRSSPAWFEGADANARLIAAAPDLLAALESITEIATRRWRPLPPAGYEKTTLATARAAINKARGR